MQLIFMVYDHKDAEPTPTIQQIAALYRPHDLIDIVPDDIHPGTEVVKHPWFRILHWPDADEKELQTLLSPLLPLVDDNDTPMTLWQRRSHHLDLSHPSVVEFTQPWLANHSTKSLTFDQTRSNFNLFGIKVAKPHIPDPEYSKPDKVESKDKDESKNR